MNGYELIDGTETHQMVMGTQAINIEGNILPPQWLKNLRTKDNLPYTTAAIILSDIVYWYRPIFPRNEKTGQPLPPRKKFKGDKLQRSYGAFVEMYGYSKKQVTQACHYLQNRGLITLEFRTVSFQGKLASNVLYIGLCPEKLAEIGMIDTPLSQTGDTLSPKRETPSLPNGRHPLSQTGDTNTETTTETTTDIRPQKNFSKNGCHKLDPLAHILSLKAQGVSEKTGPVPEDQWIVYGKEFERIYQEMTGRTLNLAERDELTTISGEDDASPDVWRKSIQAAIVNYSGKNLPPLSRMIEVYRMGQGDYEKFAAKKWPKEEEKSAQPYTPPAFDMERYRQLQAEFAS